MGKAQDLAVKVIDKISGKIAGVDEVTAAKTL